MEGSLVRDSLIQRNCVVSLSKTLYPLLVQPGKTGNCCDMTEKLLPGS